MSLTALPVTQADILNLQQKVSCFQNSGEATTRANAINAGTQTVKSYACDLLFNNTPLAQVAMGVHSVMIATPTVATFENITNNFLPGQVAVAIAHGFNYTVYAAEACGLALAGDSIFQTNFAVPATSFNEAQKAVFAGIVGNKTGVNTSAIVTYLNNWIQFYTDNPEAARNLSISVAAAGATVGDAMGVALLNSTSANLLHSCTGHINGLVSNALINNALGTYTSGTTLAALPAHGLLQGES